MKKRFETFWNTVNQKGHERITFMIIPHGEAHILSLQLSKFTMFFATLILIMVMFASILSTELQENMQTEVTELHDTNQTFFYKNEQYYKKLDDIIAYHDELKSKIVYLTEKTGLTLNDNSYEFSDNYLQQIAKDEMIKEAVVFTKQMNHLVAMKESEDIKSDVNYPLLDEYEQLPDPDEFAYNSMALNYRQLYLELKMTLAQLNTLETFLREREDVQKSLPYYYPIAAGGHFTSGYGPRGNPLSGQGREFHNGTDVAHSIGTPIYASAEGKVVRAGMSGGYGKRVMIQHRFGYSTVYAHMSTLHVSTGQYVRKGQMIGRVGITGRTTGPHLHYEVRINGDNVNPIKYMLH
ncbi:MAG: M23 family metallopeptidase [Leptospirales bacterium]